MNLDPASLADIGLQLPASVLVTSSESAEYLAHAETFAQADQGVVALGEGCFAIVPLPGDPDVVEAARAFGRRVISQAPDGVSVSGVLVPGRVTLDRHGSRLVDQTLISDLIDAPPDFEPGVLHLTSHAAYELESRWELSNPVTYHAASGRELPLWRLSAPSNAAPWRNPTLLGRARPAVDRPELAQALLEATHSRVLLVTGPMGCGKTRLLAETLEPERRSLWARAYSHRSGGPSLSHQILRQLLLPHTAGEQPLLGAPGMQPLIQGLGPWSRALDAPDESWMRETVVRLLDSLSSDQELVLVLDGLESAHAEDRDLLARLLDAASAQRAVHLVLVGRDGGRWTQNLRGMPRFRIPPLSGEETARLRTHLFEGLSMPDQLEEELEVACGGFPFTLEETLHQLARKKVLRQLYGNFFYSGGEIQLEPSDRLVRHLEAEMDRLGSGTRMRILALAERPVPVIEIEALARDLGADNSSNWRDELHRSALVDEPGEDPSDPSVLSKQMEESDEAEVDFTCDLHRAAVATTVAPNSRDPLRHRIGRQLALGATGVEQWQAYQLLRGTPEGIPVLLGLIRRPPPDTPPVRLFDAVAHELEAHRERQGEGKTELALLWALLPLGRKLGVLRNLDEAIDRALELASDDPEKSLALASLRAELDQKLGRLQQAEEALRRGLEIAKDSDERRKAMALVQLGRILQRQDRHADARRLLEDVLPSVEAHQNTALAATCRFYLGNLALAEGRLEAAQSLHERALAERLSLDQKTQIGSSMCALGALGLAMGDYPQAFDRFREAEEFLEQHGREGEVSYALLGVGRALSRLGDFTAAQSYFRRALDQRAGRDDRVGEAIAHLTLAECHLNLGLSEQAIDEARKAHFQLSLSEGQKHLGSAEFLLGRVCLHQRHYEEARQHFEAAITLHERHGDILNAAFDRAYLIDVSIAVSDHRRIEELAAALEAVLETLRYPELGERLDLRLYRALAWLKQRGKSTAPEEPLERAYREVIRKTSLLPTEMRNPFLFSVPDNQAILEAATALGLTDAILTETGSHPLHTVETARAEEEQSAEPNRIGPPSDDGTGQVTDPNNERG